MRPAPSLARCHWPRCDAPRVSQWEASIAGVWPMRGRQCGAAPGHTMVSRLRLTFCPPSPPNNLQLQPGSLSPGHLTPASVTTREKREEQALTDNIVGSERSGSKIWYFCFDRRRIYNGCPSVCLFLNLSCLSLQSSGGTQASFWLTSF